MDHRLDHRPSFALLTVDLEPGDALVAEAGAMVSHSADVDIETAAKGGVLGSIKRSVLGGESFFTNTYRTAEGGTVTLAPPLPGDIEAHDLDGSLYVQSGSFLAAEDGIVVDTKFGGARSFFGGEGLFLLRLEGRGRTFLSSYGAVEHVELAPDERYVVDTGHIVAFEGADFDVRRVGGLKSTLFSGEGLVCEFTGPGKVWLQTRSEDALLSWLIPKLPLNQGQN